MFFNVFSFEDMLSANSTSVVNIGRSMFIFTSEKSAKCLILYSLHSLK